MHIICFIAINFVYSRFDEFDVKINAEPTKLLNLYFHLNPQDLIRTSIDNKMLKQA